jgi:hypothetical protein
MTFGSDSAAGPVVGSPPVGRRLRLKSPGAVKGCFDGGWWPCSRERLTLQVVPPGVDPAVAERALEAAAAPDAAGSAVLILTTAGALGPSTGTA